MKLMAIILIILGLGLVFVSGFILGRTTTQTPQYSLRPYNGMGSGVLKHGTVVSEDYQGPQSISGVLDIKGVWILEEK